MKRVVAATLLVLALAPATAAHGFGFEPGEEGFAVTVVGEGDGGLVAGSHPYAISTSVEFQPAPEDPAQPGDFSQGDLRDLDLELPSGLIENPSAVGRCSQVQFHTPRQSPFGSSLSGENCPALSQIGAVEVRSSAGTRSFGVFNLAPPAGFPSQIGFSPFGVPVVLSPRIRDLGGEYGLTLRLRNLSQRIDLRGITLTIWGTPWAASHNGQRGNCLNEAEPGFPFAKCPISPPLPEHAPYAYLTLPASCEGSLQFAAEARSWEGEAVRATAAGPVLEECSELGFGPQTFAHVTNPRASSPSGFQFSLSPGEVPLTDPADLVPAPVRRAVVRLPEGVTLNPSLAAGLGVCTRARYAAESATSAPGEGCPNQAKIGNFTVRSPLFEDTVDGAVYLAEPDDPFTPGGGFENPFDSLLALYLVAKAPERGVLVKVVGRLGADPGSGRLTASFDRLPQLPYSNLEMVFREGQRAPLVTPAGCASFATDVELIPWNDPNRVLRSSTPLSVNKGLGAGDACPGSGPPPFAPQAIGGSLNVNAGSYSPYYLHLTRSDAEQEITSYSLTLPPGLLGNIASIPYCPEAAIEAARAKTGKEEEGHPSCPAASEIGRTFSGYGVGPVLAYAPGKLYLAGPYRGSSFSVVAVNSARVGPFDLGTIIIRSAIEVDRRSARVSIDAAGSDPIPHILQGIPIHLRDVRVHLDRPRFMLNPSTCEPLSQASTLTGSGSRLSDPGDDSTVVVPNRFQVFNCASLGFEPSFRIALRGGSRRGVYPSLRAVYRPRRGDANVSSATVTLPPSLFLAQEHIDAVCTRPQSERDQCPPGSIYGRATAVTPLLSKPLKGPVYLRASDNPLPDLVVALRGNGIAIDLVGRIDSRRGSIRARFEGLPDGPVGAFEFVLRGGRRGILVNADDLCARTQRAQATFVGHANRGVRLRPQLDAGCRGQAGQRRGRVR